MSKKEERKSKIIDSFAKYSIIDTAYGLYHVCEKTAKGNKIILANVGLNQARRVMRGDHNHTPPKCYWSRKIHETKME